VRGVPSGGMTRRLPGPSHTVRLRRPPRTPLVDEIRDLIANDLIFSGVVTAGDRLPSEKSLAERYGASRVTVRASVRSLQDAGLVNVRNGVGAVVMPLRRALTHGFDRLVSLETFGREAGKHVASREVRWEERPADAAVAERLGIAIGDPVLMVERLKTVDGTPVAWFVDTVAASAIPFHILRAEFQGAVLDVLLAHPGVDVAYEDADLEPVNLDADIARRLGVRLGTAALRVDAVTLSTDGVVLEWAQFWLLPEHFRFSVRRRPQVGRGTR